MSEHSPVLQANDLYFGYGEQDILSGVSLSVYAGELTLVTGPSGSGKSTLLDCMSTILQPDQGVAIHNGMDISTLSEEQSTDWRATFAGRVSQSSDLIGGMTVADNILTIAEINNVDLDKVWVATVCAHLGIASLMNRKPSEISGGERQRVAIARAVATKPDIVFADEPTAALDAEATEQVLTLSKYLVKELGVAMLMISHDDLARPYADNVVLLEYGKVKTDPNQKHLVTVA